MKKIHSLLLIVLVIIIGCTQKKDKNVADKLYNEGVDLYYKKDYDSSFAKFYKSYQEYLNSESNRDAALSLIYSSIIQNEKGDYLGSNENAAKAAKLLDKNDENLVSIYNQFARNHEQLKNYKEAIYFYDKAIKLNDDIYSKLVLKNNIGVINLKIKNYKEALRIFSDAANNDITKDSVDLGNKILDNFAYAKFLSDNSYNAENDLVLILNNKLKRKDFTGANASLSHLSDYFLKKDDDKSIFYAKEMYKNAKKTESINDQLEALKKIIQVEQKDLKPLFKEYQNLNDSIQNEMNNSKSQFTSVIYDSEQNKNDALESKNNLQKQYFLTLFLILAIIIIVILYRKHQIKLKQQKEIEIKNTELKYSKKVHDVVANGLYHLMIDIDNNPNINKMKILNDMEKMYEESRDISHDKITEINFHERFGKMVNSYSTAEQKVILTKYLENTWENIPQNTQSELFYVVREILVNMKKHSDAKLVVLKFEKNNDALYITYIDNGIGIKNLDNQKGAGIRNTENRIDSIGGDIIFEENPKGGLIIQITVPINL